MIFDLDRDSIPPDISAHVCIVGAGAAGIVLAAQLIRQGKRVLLLESGGMVAEPAAQALNDSAYTGQPHQGANPGRFRVLGGTTTVWGGQILEFDDADFVARPWIPGSGWPFSKAELQPYYDRALQSEGLSGALQSDSDIWRRMNIHPPNLGEEFTAYFTRWCPEPDFGRLYRELLRSPNLSVILHATATAMRLAEDGRGVRGIECRSLSGKQRTFSADRYVLSLGAIESVRFLLQPLPGGQTPSWNQGGMLGRHFHSHIDINTASIPAQDAFRLRRWFATAFLDGIKYHPKFRLNFSQQMREQILNIGGSITCINPAEAELRRLKALARNFLQRRHWTVRWHDLPAAWRQLPTLFQLAYRYRVEGRAAWPANSFFWLRAYCEQEPLSASRISLINQRDAVGMFRAQLDWRISPLEWKTIRYFTEAVQQNFARLGLANLAPRAELTQADGFRNIVLDDSHHHMGGARMASSSSGGVVNANLQLHGVDNAFLCSAAVFSCSGFSNPTHTLIALALRLADQLKGNPRA
ncbi:MAG TPA: GMC family oxidoreductase [Acidobacteriaceae bacterium]|nr:GMC family oxidoreductase [Acidobacteriaceae bacterium]